MYYFLFICQSWMDCFKLHILICIKFNYSNFTFWYVFTFHCTFNTNESLSVFNGYWNNDTRLRSYRTIAIPYLPKIRKIVTIVNHLTSIVFLRMINIVLLSFERLLKLCTSVCGCWKLLQIIMLTVIQRLHFKLKSTYNNWICQPPLSRDRFNFTNIEIRADFRSLRCLYVDFGIHS